MTSIYRSKHFAIRLVHLNAGWRYWAFPRACLDFLLHGKDIGLDENGYGTEDEARMAIEKAIATSEVMDAIAEADLALDPLPCDPVAA